MFLAVASRFLGDSAGAVLALGVLSSDFASTRAVGVRAWFGSKERHVKKYRSTQIVTGGQRQAVRGGGLGS